MQHIFEVVLDLPPDGVSRPQQEGEALIHAAKLSGLRSA